eukprot:TRINITY_DN2031_c0_g2_i2.p1 TRINITY_DN2031_c0_g2~~TRINITY_DN2031_c0_g2_i2.p1  ORF type:complete len:1590 (+),score=416.14 TRINITY_DN2031_c0_g2_i2:99-4868(+)
MGKIVLYTTDCCFHSACVKKIFNSRNIPFIEVNLFQYPLCFDDLKRLSGRTLIPCVFFNNRCIGGFSEVMALLSSHNLSKVAQDVLKEDDEKLVMTLPKANLISPIQKHIKLNVVLEENYTKIRGSTMPISTSSSPQPSNKKKKTSFKGADLIQALMNNNPSKDPKQSKEAALKMALKFQEQGYLLRPKESEKGKPLTDDGTTWEWAEDYYEDILNAKCLKPPNVTQLKTNEPILRYPLDIGSSLLSILSQLVDGFMTETGDLNYTQLKKDPMWSVFLDDLLELNLISILNEMSRKELTVFFLQMYQILRIHLIVLFEGRPKEPELYKEFLEHYGYAVEGMKFSLSTITNFLKNGERPPPFKKKKHKEKLSKSSKSEHPDEFLPWVDDRIYFIQRSLAHSSPPIININHKNIDFALQWATEEFCSYVTVSVQQRTVTLPSSFAYVRNANFSKVDDFLLWLLHLLPESEEQKLKIVCSKPSSDIKIMYKRFPWEENMICFMTEELDILAKKSSDTLPALSDGSDSEQESLDEDSSGKEEEKSKCSSEVKQLIKDAKHSPSLNLSKKNIQSTPPRELYHYSLLELKKINLSYNNITRIPKDFGESLSGLTFLYLSNNQLKEIPYCLADLENLEMVDLSHNEISYIPNRFCTLRLLRHLHLNHNKITYLHLAFAQLRALEELYLSHNELESLPHNFEEICLLEILDLSENKLKKIPDLSNLILLETLNLSSNQIQDIDFGIKSLVRLVTFSISKNHITDLPETMEKLVKLQNLYVSHNQIKRVPKEILEIPCLSTVECDENPLTDPPLKVCQQGLQEMRKHYGIEKTNISSSNRAPISVRTKGKPQMEKRASARDKRAMLMQKGEKRTDTKPSQAAASPTASSDITKILKSNTIGSGSPYSQKHLPRAMSLKESKKSSSSIAALNESNNSSTSTTPPSPNLSPSLTPTPSKKTPRDGKLPTSKPLDTNSPASSRSSPKLPKLNIPPKEKSSKNLPSLSSSTSSPSSLFPHSLIVDGISGYNVERPGSLSPRVELVEFSMKACYQNDFYLNPHVNFFGKSKAMGPVVLSILSSEVEFDDKRRNTVKSRSLHSISSKLRGIGGKSSLPKREDTSSASSIVTMLSSSLPKTGSIPSLPPLNLPTTSSIPNLQTSPKPSSPLSVSSPTSVDLELSSSDSVEQLLPASLPTRKIPRLPSLSRKKDDEGNKTPRKSARSSRNNSVSGNNSEDSSSLSRTDSRPSTPRKKEAQTSRPSSPNQLDSPRGSQKISFSSLSAFNKDPSISGSSGNISASLSTSSNNQETNTHINVLAFIRTSNMDYKLKVSVAHNKSDTKHVLKALKEQYPNFSGINFKPVRGANEEILKLEQQLMVRGYKFGVLYARDDQVTEEDWFQNRVPSPEFKEFLDFLGDHITLKGWTGYSGGLDVISDTTGTHSIIAKLGACDVMFHVSTLLPYTEDEEQQLSRKRHLGNDIVVMLFLDSDCTLQFDPTMIRSYFNHVFFIIQKDLGESIQRKITTYKIGVVSKEGVEKFIPGLPDPPYIQSDTEGKEYLLTKLINAERASYCAPGFAVALERTKEELLNELISNHIPATMAGWT